LGWLNPDCVLPCAIASDTACWYVNPVRSNGERE
jgi:hypothetical protein